ncbi:MAG: Malonyl CoA-acyl carrier protein transacylase [Syntrophomonadaceae bacterium]|nr:Malonyl CoA-acyl carrier protein transacylase [Bacillota bacterium]
MLNEVKSASGGKKIALVFPGQGSQYVGMGREFYEKYSIAKETFDAANEILGYDLKKIIFEGPLELLTQTIYTQPAVFVTSVACFKVFSSLFNLHSPLILSAGHSLGEYSALAAAEVLPFEELLKVVKARAQFIEAACQKTKGTMLAVIGSENTLKAIVSEICSEASANGVCEAVNFNAPGQIIISGDIVAIEKAKEISKSKKIRAMPLPVSGAFHSSLMKEAASNMKEELKKYKFRDPKFPVVTNCDAKITTTADEIPQKLSKQIDSPVLWDESIRRILSEGCETFVELGPKNVLTGMIKKIVPSAKTYNIENEITLTFFLEAFRNV